MYVGVSKGRLLGFARFRPGPERNSIVGIEVAIGGVPWEDGCRPFGQNFILRSFSLPGQAETGI